MVILHVTIIADSALRFNAIFEGNFWGNKYDQPSK